MTNNKKPQSKFSSKKAAFQFEDVTGVLTDRQMLFCMEYLRCKFNGTMAAKKAGYEPNNARAQAAHLLTNPNIQTYIKELKKDIGLAIGVDAIMIAREYANIAFYDISKLYNKDGSIKGIHKIDKKTRSAISSLESLDLPITDGESNGKINKVKMSDKIPALGHLAKMIGVEGVTKVDVTTKGKEIGTSNFIELPNGAVIDLG